MGLRSAFGTMFGEGSWGSRVEGLVSFSQWKQSLSLSLAVVVAAAAVPFITSFGSETETPMKRASNPIFTGGEKTFF